MTNQPTTLSRRRFMRNAAGFTVASMSLAGFLEACATSTASGAPSSASAVATSTPLASVAPSAAASAVAGGTLARIQAAKYAVVSSYNQPAHDWFTAGDGKWHGIDVDILNYVFPKIGVDNWDYVVADWSAMIPGLLAKRWDMMSIGMSVLQKRVEVVDFAEAAYRHGSVIIVPKGNPKNIKGKPDYAGHKIGAVLGAGELDDIKSVQGAEAVSYQQTAQMFGDIKLGRIDAAEMDEGEASWDLTVAPDPALDVLHDWTGKSWYLAAPVFRKEDADLKAVFDTSITEMKTNGTMQKLLHQYGFGDQNMVPNSCTRIPAADGVTYTCQGQA